MNREEEITLMLIRKKISYIRERLENKTLSYKQIEEYCNTISDNLDDLNIPHNLNELIGEEK